MRPDRSMLLSLSNGPGTLVDADICYKVRKHTWRLSTDGYVYRMARDPITRRQFYQSLHRLVAETPKGMCTDHINGDPLDNRRVNLRVCTRAENTRNKARAKGGQSRYKGVRRSRHQWCARITVNRRTTVLGYFATQEEAARAYNAAAFSHHGEFARLNVIPEKKQAS